jgi:hypothetical protein
MMGRTFLDIDMARAADLLGMERRQAEMFRDLPRGTFVALGPAMSRRPLPVRIGSVETATRSAGPRLVPPPDQAAMDEARALILNAPEPEATLPPRQRRTPRAPAPDMMQQLAQYRPPAAQDTPAEPVAPPSPEEVAERDRRLAAILRQIMADPEAPFRPAAVLYQDFLVRCRIQEIAGPPMDLPAFRRMLAPALAGIDEATMEATGWPLAVERAEALPEDAQGVYLLLARAALAGAACPSDATIARAYGSRSLGRARRMLGWLEERGTIVLRAERAGRRSVALVGLGWETAPGDPDAPEADAALVKVGGAPPLQATPPKGRALWNAFDGRLAPGSVLGPWRVLGHLRMLASDDGASGAPPATITRQTPNPRARRMHGRSSVPPAPRAKARLSK